MNPRGTRLRSRRDEARRCVQPQEGHVSSVHRIGDGEVVGEDAQIDPFGVDLGGRVERQERTIGWPGSVGEQDNGVTLGLQPGGHEVGVPDDVSGLIIQPTRRRWRRSGPNGVRWRDRSAGAVRRGCRRPRMPPRDVGELEHALPVPQGGQPKSLRHSEKIPAAAAVPMFSVKEWRGLVDMVSGVPAPVSFASCWAALHQVVRSATEVTGPARLTWRVSADYQLTQARQIQTCHGLRQSATRTHHGHRMKHHPSLLGQAELGQQLVGSRCDLGGML
jgi:hypothetical protein